MIFLLAPMVSILWALGGQINKLIRPIGIPLLTVLFYIIHHNHPWWCVLPVFLYGGILTIGYGEDSKLMKLLGNDELVRDVYSIICCIPITLMILLTGNLLALIGILLILGAFQIRLGSLGRIGKCDILPEDLIRGFIIGLAISLALI